MRDRLMKLLEMSEDNYERLFALSKSGAETEEHEKAQRILSSVYSQGCRDGLKAALLIVDGGAVEDVVDLMIATLDMESGHGVALSEEG